jgi:hypothetical protein
MASQFTPPRINTPSKYLKLWLSTRRFIEFSTAGRGQRSAKNERVQRSTIHRTLRRTRDATT